MLFHGADLPACVGMAAVQGATVALPRRLGGTRPALALARLSMLVPPAAFVAAVLLLATKPDAGAAAVSTLALVAVPLLAGLAAAGLARGSRPVLAWLVPPLVALALTRPHELGGQLAAAAVVILSCVALGSLLAQIGGCRALALGAAAIAVADLALFAAGYIAPAAKALDAAGARDNGGFFQVVLGPIHMGYGDLFVAGLVGAAAAGRGGSQRRVAVLTTALAIAEAALFAGSPIYPVTGPVVVALAIDVGWRRLGARRKADAVANRQHRPDPAV